MREKKQINYIKLIDHYKDTLKYARKENHIEYLKERELLMRIKHMKQLRAVQV
tara:strand:+ start:157 stop:315 length:159 start_codon:yes stop_codon:yes gene_type:complete